MMGMTLGKDLTQDQIDFYEIEDVLKKNGY